MHSGTEKGAIDESISTICPLFSPRMHQKSIINAKFAISNIAYVGHLFVRIAGISGALAVGLGAYGAHGLKQRTEKEREVFSTANRYHMLHTLALLAVPLCNNPNLVGVTMLLGMLGFCGTCYYCGLTGDTSLNRFTPYGGVTLMVAWAMMAL